MLTLTQLRKAQKNLPNFAALAEAYGVPLDTIETLFWLKTVENAQAANDPLVPYYRVFGGGLRGLREAAQVLNEGYRPKDESEYL